MGKALLGLLAGIALTIFVLLVLDAQPNNALSEVDEISSLRSLPGDATEDVPKRSSQGSTRDDEEQSNGVGQSNVSVIDDSPTHDVTMDQLRNLTLEELQALDSAESWQLSWKAQGELLRRNRIEQWSNAPPPTQPISLPSEFVWLAEDPDPFHEKLQREAVDPDWSFATEAQIATFLGEHPEITQKYGQPIVNCRTSGCELAFVAYGVDETVLQIIIGGQNIFSSVTEYPWADQFVSDTLFNAHTNGDVTTILWHLVKEE